jgi:hypothetical protein
VLKIVLALAERHKEKQRRCKSQKRCAQGSLTRRRASHDQYGGDDWAENDEQNH